MTKRFVEDSSKVRLVPEGRVRVLDGLNPGTAYVVRADLHGLYLEPQALQKVPSKVYGTVLSKRDRVLAGYRDRASRGQSTGILLNGEKGSGKTLLARILARDSNLPVLLITENYVGEAFRELLIYSSPCVVLFDEFEKLYPETPDGDRPNTGTQEELLTLFDGLADAKNLYIVTTNQQARIHDAMLNRPSRFFYSYDYEGLEKSFIEEYAADNLKNKKHLDTIFEVTSSCRPVNFDMLQGLVEEMNRTGESATEVFSHLNLNRRTRYTYNYKVKIKDGPKVIQGRTLRMNEPVEQAGYLHLHAGEKNNLVLDLEECEMEFQDNGDTIIKTPENQVIQLTPISAPGWTHYDAF